MRNTPESDFLSSNSVLLIYSVHGLLRHLPAVDVLWGPWREVRCLFDRKWSGLSDNEVFTAIQDLPRPTTVCQVQQLQHRWLYGVCQSVPGTGAHRFSPAAPRWVFVCKCIICQQSIVVYSLSPAAPRWVFVCKCIICQQSIVAYSPRDECLYVSFISEL
jgi:hypothetical protein